MPEYKEVDRATDSPSTHKALDKISVQFAVREEHARKIMEQYDDGGKVYEI